MTKLRTSRTGKIPPKVARVKSLYEQYLELLWLRQQIERALTINNRASAKGAELPRRQQKSSGC
jgi:hypothetical protein